MSKVSITFFGGVNEIGGNKILLHDHRSGIEIYLDFGKSFRVSRQYYEFPFTYPESIDELISIGAVPPDPKLYTRLTKQDFKIGCDVGRDPDPSVDAVFISHSHLDHYGHISLLNRRIPIYVGECSKRIILTSASLIYKRYSPEVIYDCLDLRTFRTNDEISIRKDNEELIVKPIHVDHSIPGAYGFIIYTSAGTIAYTGDFRKHGPHKRMTEEFIKELEKEEIKALIVEGTHALYSEMMSEADVFEKISTITEETDNLVIADFSRSDLDRFATFYRVARKTGRVLVIDAKRYSILSTILESPGILAKDIDLNSDVIALIDEKKRRMSPGEKNVWNMVPEDKKVDLSEIHKNPEKYIFTVVFGGAKDIKTLRPPAGSVYILSSSEPVNEEREISFEKLLNWLEHFGVAAYHIHSSGHATPLDIRELIERADPEIAIPVHTEHPVLLRNFISRIKWMIPESKGARIEIPSGSASP